MTDLCRHWWGVTPSGRLCIYGHRSFPPEPKITQSTPVVNAVIRESCVILATENGSRFIVERDVRISTPDPSWKGPRKTREQQRRKLELFKKSGV